VTKDGAVEFWWVIYDTTQIEVARSSLLERERPSSEVCPDSKVGEIEDGERRHVYSAFQA
jgi:hypothetical protein